MKEASRSEPDYDVAVLGGGPAGSTVATFLARAGRKVIVLEKERFPRFHIGESLLPYNMPLLEEMGVSEAVNRAGFMPKYGARFILADGEKGVSFRFGEGAFTENPDALQVERSRFDEILLRHAESSGAEVREGTRVRGYEVLEDRVAVDTLDGEGASPVRVEAKWLVDASGMSNFTGNREGIRVDHPDLKKLALFSHFEGVTLPKTRDPGDIIIVHMESAWSWIIPLSPTRVSLGIVIDRTALKEKGGKPEELYHAMIQDHPNLRDSFGQANRVEPVRSVADYSYMNREFVGDRLVRIGDAAGFLDPIFSSGVYLAMVMGRNSAKALDKALGRNASQKSFADLRKYERSTRKAMGLYRTMIEKFYTKEFIEMFLDPQDLFQLPAAVNALLAGRLDNPWKMRWRLALFYALVKLQRRFTLVPRLKGS